MSHSAGAVPGQEPGAGAGFYVTGGTLRADAPSYVERQADRDLLGGLLQSEFCYVLTSRQMGKSSLMVRTAQKLRDRGVQVVVLDLTAIGQNLTPEQWYDGLLQRLGRQLRLEDELDDFWRDQTRLGPCQRFFAALREVALVRKTGSLVIFVDELDLVRSLPFGTDEFFGAVRGCFNESRVGDPEFSRLSFCLLGVATPSDLIKDPNNTPFNIGRRIVLTDFTPAEAAPLARGFEQPGRDPAVAPAILKRILDWTNGHPYLTQRLCREMAAQRAEISAEGAAPAVDRLCRERFLTTRARTEDDNLLFVRERLLRGGPSRNPVLRLYRKVRRGRRVRDDDSNPVITALLLAGVVRLDHGCLTGRNRIYHEVFDQEWITANLVPAERTGLRSRPAIFAMAAGVMLVLALAWKQWNRSGNPLGLAPKDVALAVLPLNVIDPEGPNDPALAGLMESVADTLAQPFSPGPVIRVVPPRELRAAAATNAIKAGRAFGVDHVLLATLDRSKPPWRISMELADPRNGSVTRRQTASVNAGDLREFHKVLVTAAAEWLGRHGRPPQPGTNASAVTVYFRGLSLLGDSEGLEDAGAAVEVLRQAEREFGKAVRLDERFAEARVGLAATALRLFTVTHQPSWLAAAESNALPAVKLAPTHVPALLLLSKVCRSRGNGQEATSYVEDARRWSPDGADVLEEVARIYEDERNFVAAETLLRFSQQKHPQRWTTTAALGRLYGVWNRYTNAIPLLEEVVRRVPNNPKAWINLANAEFSLGHDDAAITAARSALAITPCAEAHNTLGTILYLQGKFVDAAGQFSNARKHKPSDHALWGGLGDAYRMIPDPAHATEAYRQAERLALADLDVNPSDTFARSGLALYRAHLGRHELAREDIALALKGKLGEKPSGDVLFIASLVFEEVGARLDAIKHLEDALKSDYPTIMARRYPDLAELFKDEKAGALRERLGLP